MLLWLSIFGFPLVAAVSFLIGMPSTPLSIAMRGFVGVLALVTLIRFTRFGSGQKHFFSVALTLFGLMYCARIFISAFAPDIELSRPLWVFGLFFFAGCFLPAVCVCNSSGIASNERSHKFMVITLLAALIVLGSILRSGEFVFEAAGGYTVESGRVGLTSLNPIFAGHFAVSILLMLLFQTKYQGQSSVLYIPLACFVAVMAVYVVIGAASRGPIIAGVLAFLITRFGLSITFFSILLLVSSVGAILVGGSPVIEATDWLIVERFLLTADANSNSWGRYELYISALEIFMSSPLFGAALEDPEYRTYPHNIFIEVLMTTGVVGALFFALVFGQAIRVALKARKYSFGSLRVFAALFFQYLVAAQFSGGIYTATALWVLTGLLCNYRILTERDADVDGRVHGKAYGDL